VPAEALVARLSEPRAGTFSPAGEVSLPLRLYTDPRLHRALPDAIAVLLAAARGRATANRGPRAQRLRAELELTLADTAREQDVPALIVPRSVEGAVFAELDWRPWMLEQAVVQGLEKLEAAQRQGLGVVLVKTHVGQTFAPALALGARGVAVYSLTGRWMIEPHPGYQGRRWHHLLKVQERRGVRCVTGPGAFGSLQALLRQAKTVLISCDTAGSFETTFLGKPARMATGPAALAIETGSPVLPIYQSRSGTQLTVTIGEPLGPVAGEGLEPLQHRVLDYAAREILRAPEQFHSGVLDQLWPSAEARR